jgi:hypothetical protein
MVVSVWLTLPHGFSVFDYKGKHVVCGLPVLLEANAIPSPISGYLNDIVWFVNKDDVSNGWSIGNRQFGKLLAFPLHKVSLFASHLQTSTKNSAIVKRSKQKGKTQEDHYFPK